MVKPKSFRAWNPEQTLLLPPSPVDWLPENHLVFFLLDLASELDLEEIHAIYRQKDPRGEKAYDPRMIVVLLLYAYCVGLPSSRKIEKPCWEDAAFRVLTGNQKPDHSRISDFRRRPANGRSAVRSVCVASFELVLAFLLQAQQRKTLSLAALQQRFRLPPRCSNHPDPVIPQHLLVSYDHLLPHGRSAASARLPGRRRRRSCPGRTAARRFLACG